VDNRGCSGLSALPMTHHVSIGRRIQSNFGAYRSRGFGALLSASCFLAGLTEFGVAQQIPVVERSLSNGFRLLLVERHNEPRIAGGFVVKVGSANERPGITGIAHLFEQMMFKGTPTLGTKDSKRDSEIIQEQEQMRDQMRVEEARMRDAWRRGELEDLTNPETKSPRWKELEKQFQKLIEAQREILVKNEFDRVYTTAGASGMNAFTTEDMTGYFINVPANKLELWMWMESERLLRPVFREFYAERDVVFEERRMRTESTPLGKFAEQFNAMFWDAHPYHWPVIGWPSDIPAISKAQADDFFSLYYQPQNITLVLVGDFKSGEVETMVSQYFGRIPKGNRPPPEVSTLEVPQLAEKRMYAEAETNPQVDILWRTVAFQHKDGYALNVLEQLLLGRTGRLYKGLVQGRQIATDIYASQDSRKWAGLFNAGAEVKEGHTHDEVEQAIYAELDRLKNETIADEELQKVKNQFAAGAFRRLTSNMPILMQLIFSEGSGDWREVNEAFPKIQAVTSADVQRVAQKYFTKENRSVAIYSRKVSPGSNTDDPDIAGLAGDQKPIIRQFLGMLNQEKDASKLKSMLEQMDAGAATDPKKAQFQKILRKKLEARIAELQKK
jgi:predicted Zn-dependent peptidase